MKEIYDISGREGERIPYINMVSPQKRVALTEEQARLITKKRFELVYSDLSEVVEEVAEEAPVVEEVVEVKEEVAPAEEAPVEAVESPVELTEEEIKAKEFLAEIDAAEYKRELVAIAEKYGVDENPVWADLTDGKLTIRTMTRVTEAVMREKLKSLVTED